MHMRTTLDLPKDLLDLAQELTGSATRRQTVITALEELIRAQRRQELLDMLGRTPMRRAEEELDEAEPEGDPAEETESLRLMLPSKGNALCLGKRPV